MSETPQPADVFGKIFKEGLWKGSVPSGPGSSLGATAHLRPQLAELFQRLDIRSLCDAPCGDGTWITDITQHLDFYFGFDVVPELILANCARELPLNHLFRVADITAQTLPSADAILCRDCLVHFPLETAQATLKRFCDSGSTYLLTTTFSDRDTNIQARMGSWRPLNLRMPPFNLPAPLHLMRERAPNAEDKYNDKCIGVWRLADLKPHL